MSIISVNIVPHGSGFYIAQPSNSLRSSYGEFRRLVTFLTNNLPCERVILADRQPAYVYYEKTTLIETIKRYGKINNKAINVT